MVTQIRSCHAKTFLISKIGRNDAARCNYYRIEACNGKGHVSDILTRSCRIRRGRSERCRRTILRCPNNVLAVDMRLVGRKEKSPMSLACTILIVVSRPYYTSRECRARRFDPASEKSSCHTDPILCSGQRCSNDQVYRILARLSHHAQRTGSLNRRS